MTESCLMLKQNFTNPVVIPAQAGIQFVEKASL